MSCCTRADAGQATVEAAFLLPVLFLVLGLFCQPALLFYDRCVMQAAVAEGCRAVAASSGGTGEVRAYVLRRLDAIPDVDAFHCGGREGWTVSCSGGETSEHVRVTVSHRVRPLPLLGVVAGFAMDTTDDGLIEQRAACETAHAAPWLAGLGSSPDDWIGAWK